MTRLWAALAAIGFLATIVAANYATSEHGLVPVGFGLVTTAGTYFAGLAFVLRDAVQDTAGRRATLVVIALGALLSYLLADPFIALASAVAFGVSEVVDQAIYTPLRRRGYVRAAIASNLAGGVVDTALFLWIAGFPIWAALPGQLVAKMTVTGAAIAIVGGRRAVLRHDVVSKGA